MKTDKLHKQLESLGEDEVRDRLALAAFGDHGSPRRNAAENWLEMQDRQRQELQRGEFLEIAREANRLAVWALVIAGVSFVAAVVALIL